ncbi:hypothetical protein YTPLAS21_17450 [Candidatus Nitrosocosmicus sp.]|nr:hypothetical protein YTPLAS21_17450 [Candidatus Nitrosocosmicus sp.]
MKFKYIFLTMVLAFGLSISFLGVAYGQVSWKIFDEEKGLFSIQIPSNWFPERLPEGEKLAPIDFIFSYSGRGDSFAWVELLISNSYYFNARDASEAYMLDYKQYDDFGVLQPIDCESFTLGGMEACAFTATFRLEEENQRNALTLISVTPDGIQYEIVFVASTDIFNTFLPVGKYIINSVSIDSNRIKEFLNNSTLTDAISEIPPIPVDNTTVSSMESEIPPISNQTSNVSPFLSETSIYENPISNFALQYPSNWTIDERGSPPSSILLASPKKSITDQAPETIAVTTEVVTAGTNLEEYSNSAVQVLRTLFPNMIMVNSSTDTLAGHPANVIEYTYSQNERTLKNIQIWSMVNDVVYVITYGALLDEFDSSLDVFNKVVDSFSIR